MALTRMRYELRERVIKLLLRALGSEESTFFLNKLDGDYGGIRSSIPGFDDPYTEPGHSGEMGVDSPIFISGRFRSGSTLLWNIFRNTSGYTAYYEPFNERRWFDLDHRGGHTDTTHRGVSEYWAEYAGLDELKEYYREDWIRHRLYMNEQSFDFAMKEYVNTLINRASDRAVLQFNRADFRLGWLRANYPKAKIIHIYRNPRDQWCSVLGNHQGYSSDETSSEGFHDRFYLRMWCRDLCRQFPFLADYYDRHQYFLFYFLWKLSYCFGRHYADISVAMEDLTSNPEATTQAILDAVSIGPERMWVRGSDLDFVTPSASRWHEYASDQWFRAIEQECNAIVMDFLKGRPAT